MISSTSLYTICIALLLSINASSALVSKNHLSLANARSSSLQRSSSSLSASVWSTTLFAPKAPATRLLKKILSVPSRTKKNNRSQEEDRKNNNDNELWEIQIHDNSVLFDYQVAEILVKIANLSEMQAFRAMRHAEKNGVSTFGEYDFEMAEHYVHALKEYQLSCEMKPIQDFQ